MFTLDFLREPVWQGLTWTLLHFLWEGLAVAAMLLPAAWITEMTPDILEAVIAHELAHIRRWDLWATLFQRLVEHCCFITRPSGGFPAGCRANAKNAATSWPSRPRAVV